jgi:hypothetical protein
MELEGCPWGHKPRGISPRKEAQIMREIMIPDHELWDEFTGRLTATVKSVSMWISHEIGSFSYAPPGL